MREWARTEKTKRPVEEQKGETRARRGIPRGVTERCCEGKSEAIFCPRPGWHLYQLTVKLCGFLRPSHVTNTTLGCVTPVIVQTRPAPGAASILPPLNTTRRYAPRTIETPRQRFSNFDMLKNHLGAEHNGTPRRHVFKSWVGSFSYAFLTSILTPM